jgi:cytochrome c553
VANPGKMKYVAVCQGCHGATGGGQGPFPKLTGIPVAELVAKLNDYRAGKQVGPQSSTMIPFAKPLTDIEIASISEYLASL